MLKKLAILLSAVALVACGEQSAIEAAVKENLKDPESARFADLVVSKSGSRACVSWNAKNSFGGYGEQSIAELAKANDVWTVEEMKGRAQNCGEPGFKAREAEVVAEKEAAVKVLATIQRVRSMTREQAELLARHDCSGMMVAYTVAAKALARATALGQDTKRAQERKANYEKTM